MKYVLFVATWIAILFFFGESIAQDDWKAPKLSKEIPNPLVKFRDNIKMLKLGEILYGQNCATCHGSSKEGDGVAGRYLKTLPTDLTTGEFLSQTDGEMMWKIEEGRSPMPSFKEELTAKKIWLIINYLRIIKRAN